jgi:beta-N-acetylhexosaminidase
LALPIGTRIYTLPERLSSLCYIPDVQWLRQKLGQMLMVGCQGEILTRDEELVFEEYGFGGFVLFRQNCRSPEQIADLCRSLWNTAADQPPFLAIDQEGGRVHRLPEPFTHFSSAAQIGQSGDTQIAYQCGRATAAELSVVGLNLDFAPVLDVNSNPANPIIGDRAFGTTPERVIEMSSAWMRGLRDGGVIPCGKHFPGHGDTERDSHLELPVVEKSLDQLRKIELPPFVDACRNGIEALMTAHVRFTALDRELPATLSEAVVTGMLRHQFGYDGVIFSDDMEMKAISANFPPAEAAALALRAGVDVLLFCHELTSAIEVFESLCALAENDPALRARIEASSRRITGLKRSFLTAFTGSSGGESLARLKAMNHQRIVDRVYGSL